MKSKMEYVRQLRRLNNPDNLERVIDHLAGKLSAGECCTLHEAADHRRAEIIMNTHFDKVPKTVWRYVR